MKKLRLTLIGDEVSQRLLDQLDGVALELDSRFFEEPHGRIDYTQIVEDIQSARARVFATCNPTGFELTGE